jgi:hypothetical protein
MPPPVAIFGVDITSLVGDGVRALIEVVVPDFGADWASRLVTWLVALPSVTGSGFPALNRYAGDLTAIGFGLLGANLVATAVQLAAGTTSRDAGDALKRAAIAAGMLAFYPTLMEALITGVNVLTAEMIRHPLVRDGLDKAFGEALVLATITSGVSLGLAAGAAIVVLYFVAALFALKIGLTAALAVTVLAGALVWGLSPLPQAEWLPRAWAAALIATIIVPIAWACVFTAAALLAADTLAFDNTSSLNRPLGEGLENLVKPFAAVACFWLAYKAPGFLMGVARSAGMSPSMLRTGGRGASAGGGTAGRGPEALVTRGVRTNHDRFCALTQRATTAYGPKIAGTRAVTAARTATAKVATTRPVAAARRANDAWRALSAEGRDGTRQPPDAPAVEPPAPKQSAPKSSASKPTPAATRSREKKAPRSAGPRPRSAKPKSPATPKTAPTRAPSSTTSGPKQSAAPKRKPTPAPSESAPKPRPKPAAAKRKPPSPPKQTPSREPRRPKQR